MTKTRLTDNPSVSQQFVERSEAGAMRAGPRDFQCKAHLPRDRLVVITASAIEIYATHDSNDKAFPELLLLHRVGSTIHPCGTSQPFVGQRYILGWYLRPSG